MAITTPTADLQLVYTGSIGGALTVDFALTPAGDLALVTGINRLQQDILRWLLTPQGSDPFDVQWGNPLFALIGQPRPRDDTDVLDMIEQAEAYFIARQQSAIAAGTLSLDERVSSFEDTQVDLSQPGLLSVSFRVVAQSGASARMVVPFSISASL